MSTLVAIGYPDEGTATAAAQGARRLARELVIEPDVAVPGAEAQPQEALHGPDAAQ